MNRAGSQDEAAERAGWVRAAQGGDRAAFARLHAVYGGLVHSVLLARVPSHEAEDLVQDVFLSAWRRLPGLRQPDAFGGWLASIARNRAVDHLRRRRPTEALGEVARASAPTAEANEALDAIRSLPETYREALILRLVEGWSGPEIAARTGLTPGSVRVKLHRGMQLLRARLGGTA